MRDMFYPSEYVETSARILKLFLDLAPLVCDLLSKEVWNTWGD